MFDVFRWILDPYALRFLLPHVEEDEWRAADADWSACIPFFSAGAPMPPSSSSSSPSSSDGHDDDAAVSAEQTRQQQQQQQQSHAESLMGMMERYSGDSAELVHWYFAPPQLGLRLAVMGCVTSSSVYTHEHSS